MAVVLKMIKMPTVDLYSPDSEFLGTINEYEFYDVRVQIKKQKLDGYYVVFQEEKVKIDKNGKFYPPKQRGMFDFITRKLIELF